jgi:hypothetical protein
MKLFGSKKALMKARDKAAHHLNLNVCWLYATLFPLFFMFVHATDKIRHITLFLRPEVGLKWAGRFYLWIDCGF